MQILRKPKIILLLIVMIFLTSCSNINSLVEDKTNQNIVQKNIQNITNPNTQVIEDNTESNLSNNSQEKTAFQEMLEKDSNNNSKGTPKENLLSLCEEL